LLKSNSGKLFKNIKMGDFDKFCDLYNQKINDKVEMTGGLTKIDIMDALLSAAREAGYSTDEAIEMERYYMKEFFKK